MRDGEKAGHELCFQNFGKKERAVSQKRKREKRQSRERSAKTDRRKDREHLNIGNFAVPGEELRARGRR